MIGVVKVSGKNQFIAGIGQIVGKGNPGKEGKVGSVSKFKIGIVFKIVDIIMTGTKLALLRLITLGRRGRQNLGRKLS